MVQHESSDFFLIDALKKWKTGKLFHHCDTSIYEVFCHFFFDTTIKGKKNIKQKKTINFISQIMLLVYRDGGNIDSSGSTSYGSFSIKNYECIGNEASIDDCPNNEKNCISTTKFLPRTELRCKRKTY